MKKGMIPFFCSLLVFTLLLGSFGNAKAAVGDDPVVTPVSGDMEFTTEVVPIASLPGTSELDQMLVPVGFPEGEAQFEGAGVLVTKFDAGKATACFTISGTQFGWGGKVGMWDGKKWVMLPTTIKTTGDDGTSTTACTSITGNGTYTFIKYVTDPTLLPVNDECIAITSVWSIHTDTDAQGRYFYISMDSLPNGTPATLTFINAVPMEQYFGFTGVDTSYVGNFVSTDTDFFNSNFSVIGTVGVTLRVTAGGCTAVLFANISNSSSQ